MLPAGSAAIAAATCTTLRFNRRSPNCTDPNGSRAQSAGPNAVHGMIAFLQLLPQSNLGNDRPKPPQTVLLPSKTTGSAMWVMDSGARRAQRREKRWVFRRISRYLFLFFAA